MASGDPEYRTSGYLIGVAFVVLADIVATAAMGLATTGPGPLAIVAVAVIALAALAVVGASIVHRVEVDGAVLRLHAPFRVRILELDDVAALGVSRTADNRRQIGVIQLSDGQQFRVALSAYGESGFESFADELNRIAPWVGYWS